jgi:hypothetical protein
MAADNLLSAIWAAGLLGKTPCSARDKIGLLTWWSCAVETQKVRFCDWIAAKTQLASDRFGTTKPVGKFPDQAARATSQ